METRHRPLARHGRAALFALAAAALVLPVGSGATERTEIDVWPLLEIREDATTVLYPLYAREGKSVTAFPFYYRTNEGRDHHLVWPLVKVSDGRLERVAPVWLADDEAYTLFPLVRRTEEATTLLVPPSRWRHDGSLVALLPLYVRSGGRRFYAPSLWIEEREARDGTTDLARLGAFPLFAWERSPRGAEHLSVLLLARGGWADTERTGVLLPLAGARRGSADDYTWLGPWYRDRDDHLLAPLYYAHDGARARERWILTWRKREGERLDVSAVYPLYAEREERLGRGRERRVVSALWPLYRREEIVGTAGRRESRRRRFLVFSDTERADGVRRFEILGVPVAETVEDRGRRD